MQQELISIKERCGENGEVVVDLMKVSKHSDTSKRNDNERKCHRLKLNRDLWQEKQ